MSVIVYIWQTSVHDHASIKIEDEYISFHPSNPNKLDALTNQPEGKFIPRDFFVDKIHYGEPKKTIFIDGLDEDLMLSHWEKIYDHQYQLWTNNCSTVVATLLRAGTTVDDSVLFDFQIAATKFVEIFGRGGADKKNWSEFSGAYLSMMKKIPKSALGKIATWSLAAVSSANSLVSNPHEVALLAEMIKDKIGKDRKGFF